MNGTLILAGLWLTVSLIGCGPTQTTGTPSLTTHSDRAALLAASADSLVAARRYQEAADQYAAALAIQPDSLGIAGRALGSFWRSARYDEAYSWGHRVLEREPRSLNVLFSVGVACGFLVALDCVDSIFRRAIEIDSTYVTGYGELAFLAQARGDLAAAVRYMESAYAVAPDSDLAISGLAHMLIPAGDPVRALRLMEPRLAANRSAPAYGGRSMLTLYGWALLTMGDTVAANRVFDEMLKRLRERERASQTTYQLYRERAAILALRGDGEAAISAMQEAFARGWRLYASCTLPDPMFAAVLQSPKVTPLIEWMRADVQIMRRRLSMTGGC